VTIIITNTLDCGNSLGILREYIPEESPAGPRSGQAPINIILAQAQRVQREANQGKLL